MNDLYRVPGRTRPLGPFHTSLSQTSPRSLPRAVDFGCRVYFTAMGTLASAQNSALRAMGLFSSDTDHPGIKASIPQTCSRLHFRVLTRLPVGSQLTPRSDSSQPVGSRLFVTAQYRRKPGATIRRASWRLPRCVSWRLLHFYCVLSESRLPLLILMPRQGDAKAVVESFLKLAYFKTVESGSRRFSRC